MTPSERSRAFCPSEWMIAGEEITPENWPVVPYDRVAHGDFEHERFSALKGFGVGVMCVAVAAAMVAGVYLIGWIAYEAARWVA